MDTLEYLKKGGRISKAVAFAGAVVVAFLKTKQKDA